jgi:hypothetical protein
LPSAFRLLGEAHRIGEDAESFGSSAANRALMIATVSLNAARRF